MNRKALWIVVALVVLVAAVIAFQHLRQPQTSDPGPEAMTKVVINEAVRTLVYIPIYFAQQHGYFRDAGLEVEIVTGGTATNSFAAMTSGEAQFSVADPMYVPISREQGALTKVVAQVVARIAVWGLTMEPGDATWTAENVSGSKVSTQVRPMTAYVYAVKAVQELGLDPEKDVEVLQNKPPSEIAPLLAGQAEFAFTLEPNTSLAESQGAHVILSYPEKLGDQVFTGLMVREDYLAANRETVRKVVSSLQRAMNEIHADPEVALSAAIEFFPQLDPEIVRTALNRLVREEVIPTSVEISEESWNRAIQVRVNAGDLARAVPRAEGCDLPLMEELGGRE